MNDPQDIRNLGSEIWGTGIDEQTVKNLTGKSWHDVMYYLVSAWPWTNRKGAELEMRSRVAQLEASLKTANDAIVDLNKQLDAAKKSSGTYTEADRELDKSTNAAVQWIRELLSKVFK